MRCPQCHNGNIVMKVNDHNNINVQCSNCGHDIEVINSPLLEVMLYNYDVEQIKEEGRIAFLEGELISDCPYDDDYKTVWSRGFWHNGWLNEQKSMEGTSQLLSAKKESEELRDSRDALKANITKCNELLVEKNEEIDSQTEQLENARGILKDQEKELAEMNKIRNATITDLSQLKGAGYWRTGTYVEKIGGILQRDCEKFMKIPIL